MKIINPTFATQQNPEKWAAQHRAAVVAVLQSMAATVDGMTFDDVRAALPAKAVELPDGVLHQIALSAGFVVK